MLIYIQTRKWHKVIGRGSGKDHCDAIMKIREHYVKTHQDLRKISWFLQRVGDAWNPYELRIESMLNGSRDTE